MIILVSRLGLSGETAWDIVREGGEVKYYGFGLDGIVDKSGNWVDEDGILIFDDTLYGLECEIQREKGKVVFGGSRLSDRLELDRKFMYEFAEKIGLDVPEWKPFKSIKDGIAFLRNAKGKWVFKPSGKISDIKELTHIGEWDELIGFMKWVYTRYGNFEYILQKFVDG